MHRITEHGYNGMLYTHCRHEERKRSDIPNLAYLNIESSFTVYPNVCTHTYD